MSCNLPDPVQVLGLSDKNENTQLSNNKDLLIQTIFDELGSVGHYPDQSQTLQIFGYTGETNDIPALTTFLLSTLQAHRILAQRQSHTSLTVDQATTNQLSSMMNTLNILPPATSASSFQELASVIKRADISLQDFIRDHGIEPPRPIVSDRDRDTIEKDANRKTLLENILRAIQREHFARIGMLLTRLEVTIHSFSHSDRIKVNSGTFYSLSQSALRLQARWRKPNPITIHQVLSATPSVIHDAMRSRRGISETNRISSHVKDFIMGAVPDRGGRLTNNETQMPDFKKREKNSGSSAISSTRSRKEVHHKSQRGKDNKRKR